MCRAAKSTPSFWPMVSLALQMLAVRHPLSLLPSALQANLTPITLITTGKVYSFGLSAHGLLGREESESQVEFPNDDMISFISKSNPFLFHPPPCTALPSLSFPSLLCSGLCYSSPHLPCTPLTALVVDSGAGTTYSVAVSENGYNLYTWGLGAFGAGDLADGGRTVTPKPELFHIVDPRTNARKASKVVQVACGNRHTLALCEDGEVYSWGSGSHGRLGHTDVMDRATPTLIKAFVVNSEQCVVMVAAGDSHSMALSKEGRVYTWGSGSYGR